jgi:lysophospholipase L1-like esterase
MLRALSFLLAAAALAIVLLWLTMRFYDFRMVPPRIGMSEAPCAQFDQANGQHQSHYDWAKLCTFEAENAQIAKSGTRPTVVMIGDSLTWRWDIAQPGIVMRGIPGQSSAQLLVRFRQDVVALRPQVVHILVGTNDIAGNSGPSNPQRVIANIASMVDLAQANGIVSIVATVPPAKSFSWAGGIKPYPWIDRLNAQIRELAKERGLLLADYHAELVGSDGRFRSGLYEDEAHPNRAGYARMRPVLDVTIARALAD